MRWIIGIALFFVTIFVANGWLVYSALKYDDPIVQSYIEDPR